MLRFLTAGESHGDLLTGILDGLPAGLKIDKDFINEELSRRQSGYGRGARMQIETDKVQITAGVINSITIASPIGLLIKNHSANISNLDPLYFPRPGHGDFAGGLKYGFENLRYVLERASARETAMRVAVGAISKTLLAEFKIKVSSKVLSIGREKENGKIREAIDKAREKKDTLGGLIEVTAQGVPVGLGSYVQYDRRLDANLAFALMSIPAIKGVEAGLGFGYADKYGSQVHDAIYYSKNKGYWRSTNNAGGVEAGVSNGEDVVLRVCMKPIATLGNPLDSIDIRSKKPHKAQVERYDTCAVEACAVVVEAMVAFEIAKAFLDKFGADTLRDIKKSFNTYQKEVQK